MLKKFLITLGGFIAVFLALGGVKAAQIKKAASSPHTLPPIGVATFESRAETWRPTLNAIGTLAPVQGVTISAEIDGTVVRVAAENGATVKAGDLLVELDTSVERSQVAAAEARAELAKINIDRTRGLFEQKAISRSEFDAATAAYKQAGAEVAALRAVIGKKQVRAPFEGRVGIRVINLGQYVGRGAPLMPLQRLDPVYVNFSLPQRHLPALAIGQRLGLQVDAFAGRRFDATVSAINAEVDAVTRNIFVQATVPNPREELRSGMFARVEVELPGGDQVVVVPATAIAYASYGNSVYVVERMKGPDGAEYLGVRQQFVKLGGTRGDLVGIVDGLKPGQKVVSTGVFKLRNGAEVQINDSVQPSANSAPRLPNT
ncbi:MAG: efflux RND transporter periplasmic adaptor subunit [Opitutaceae bacterium]|jgi:membrane fusion protein (multidrug efflux system)|nr:efflux RND transporter periplasmic adaptor subunit [Opitutaceae bacterium]